MNDKAKGKKEVAKVSGGLKGSKNTKYSGLVSGGKKC